MRLKMPVRFGKGFIETAGSRELVWRDDSIS